MHKLLLNALAEKIVELLLPDEIGGAHFIPLPWQIIAQVGQKQKADAANFMQNCRERQQIAFLVFQRSVV